MDVNFSEMLTELRGWNYSDQEIAEELAKTTHVPVTRQKVYNYRTGLRKYPANFNLGVAIIELHNKVKTTRNYK